MDKKDKTKEMKVDSLAKVKGDAPIFADKKVVVLTDEGDYCYVQLEFGEWMDMPLEEMPDVPLEYILKDFLEPISA